MTRPFWQTLAWKLTLAFVLVSALALGTVGVISNVYTRSEFSSFIGDQAREDLANRIQTHVQETGSLEGFVPYRRNDGPQGAPRTPDPGRNRGDTPGTPNSGQDDGPLVWRGTYLVLDPQRRALFDSPGTPRGTRITDDRAGRAEPVSVDGEVVAYLVPSGLQPRLDRRSEEFLARTSSAIAWSMLAATLAAILMGLLVSRAMLAPLRQLLNGIHAMQRGQAPATPPRRRHDEFGEVLGAFHEMHDSVVRNQQSRRQLTANIAHDLNTPLAVISGTLEAMLDGTFKPTHERLARLHRETRHVSSLVNDLRFLALADAGELHLNVTRTDLARVVREAVDGLRELATRQGVTLDLRLPSGEVYGMLDATRLTQVVQNLLGNALAHTPAGGRVVVEVGPRGTAARVTVRDTGAGIAPDKLPFVFDRLFRADEARAEGGSGLGLSICRSIVQAHGGTIGIESAPGEGTTVTFELPLDASPSGAAR